ncbi:ACR116Wp [Eremothecium gossypii ATCC 10895]|uniref:ACR116Wp n=1 Tax=Eremothecium gossypii (strain ATCC 10895 / CBS 109.51 / FGSC 9923 / NRRL Y-1056) TaxID=284811 RepID=Q75C03_EREGS|nr:ACR116Wp [Eremothecium gossypii ATCC 10895]AAS51342.2 ACR116Wp [Eremothecium gossypii ATCC 10895]
MAEDREASRGTPVRLRQTTNDVPDPTVNKIKNEQFKVWKKTIPSLYQYITSLKPRYASPAGVAGSVRKTIAFTDEAERRMENGVLHTSVLVSLGRDVYRQGCVLPLGVHLEEADGGGALPDPEFEDSMGLQEQLRPVWTHPSADVAGMAYVGRADVAAVVVATDGSVAWFRSGAPRPVQTLPPVAGSVAEVDLAVSEDGQLAVVVQSGIDGDNAHTVLRVVDNGDALGKVLHTVRLSEAAVVHAVKFQGSHIFVTCSSDNTVRFWDARTPAEPLWHLHGVRDGRFVAVAPSPLVGTVFATGSDTGVIKLWDIRAVIAATADEPAAELTRLVHPDGDAVVELLFSADTPTQFVSVGAPGNVYHWDVEPLLQLPGEDDPNESARDSDELQQQCLKFLHTVGGRRTLGPIPKRKTVAWHPTFGDVVGCIDADGLITVYKPYFGRPDDPDADDDSLQ